jgi:hypothetical protein
MEALENNLLIDILVTGIASTDGDLFGDLSHSFATTFDPLLSTPNKVRAIAGSYVQEISDSMLLYLINTYSVEAYALAHCLSEDNEDKWQYYASLWVTYSAALNAVYNSKAYAGESANKVYKKLGDFSISKDNTKGGSGPAKGLIDKLECEIFKLSVAVRYCRDPLLECIKGSGDDLYNPAAAQLVVKGSNLARPAFGRTFYPTGRHPQWTGIIKGYNNRYHLTNYEPFYPSPDPSDSGYVRR